MIINRDYQIMMIFVQEFHLFIIVKATGNNCKEILIEVPIILSFNLKSRAFERKMQNIFLMWQDSLSQNETGISFVRRIIFFLEMSE